MGPVTEFFRRFGSNDAGAVTVDWITLSSAALVGGIIAIYAIYGAGVGALTAEVNSIPTTAFATGPGPVPVIGGG